VAYSYDRAGNRSGMNDDGIPTWYTTNNLNQYIGATGQSLSNGGEHEISAHNGVSYYYINDERLKQVTSGSNNYYLYYDALGRCVKRKLNNVTTYYIYDGEKPILEYNSAGSLVGRNVYGKGIDEILRREYGGQNYYLQQDRNGNVTHLTNASGSIVEKYKYDAFGAVTMYDGQGNLLTNGTAYNNRFLFTGREYAATYAGTYIAAFNFYEYRARAYNPKLGRFMSEDPKGFDAGDYNLFRYCHNDPLDLTDPMGLFQIQPGDMLPNGQNVLVNLGAFGSAIPVIVPLDASKMEALAKGATGIQLGLLGGAQQLVRQAQALRFQAALRFNPAKAALQTHNAHLMEQAGRYGVEPNLVRGVILRESAGFWPADKWLEAAGSAFGKSGTYGIAQLGAAARAYSGMSILDAMDDKKAIRGASAWLGHERDRLQHQGVPNPSGGQIATRYNWGSAPAGKVSSYGHQVEYIMRRIEEGAFGQF
jgi:RHS repeat-associated protein